jgi:hypothetical protein
LVSLHGAVDIGASEGTKPIACVVQKAALPYLHRLDARANLGFLPRCCLCSARRDGLDFSGVNECGRRCIHLDHAYPKLLRVGNVIA